MKFLPFINMCLRAWMTRLAEDVNLWPTLDVLDFEVWIIDEMKKPKNEMQIGKTSYDLMVSIFGEEEESEALVQHNLWGKSLPCWLHIYFTSSSQSIFALHARYSTTANTSPHGASTKEAWEQIH